MILNFVTLLLSIPIIAGGIWLSRQANTECERFLNKPVIVLGVFVLLVSIAGLVGSCCRISWLLWVYLLVMFLLILLLFCFTIFAFVVTNKGAGEAVTGKGYKEYRLGDYSNWLQKRVNNNWGRIRSCLADSKICEKLLDDRSTLAEDFYKERLSALQHAHIGVENNLPGCLHYDVQCSSDNERQREHGSDSVAEMDRQEHRAGPWKFYVQREGGRGMELARNDGLGLVVVGLGRIFGSVAMVIIRVSY